MNAPSATWTSHLRLLADAAAYTNPVARKAAPTASLMAVHVWSVDQGLDSTAVLRELELRAGAAR